MWDSFLPKRVDEIKVTKAMWLKVKHRHTQSKWDMRVGCILGSKLPGSRDGKGNMINYKHARSLKTNVISQAYFRSRGLLENGSPRVLWHSREGLCWGRFKWASNQHFHKAPAEAWCDALMGRMDGMITVTPPHTDGVEHGSDCTVLSQLLSS